MPMKNHSPSPDADTDTAPLRDGKKPQFGGCLYPFLSFLIVSATQIIAGDIAAIAVRTAVPEVAVMVWAPVSSLAAWWILFCAPLPVTWQPAELQQIRRMPALARHALLWIAMVMIGAALILHMHVNR